MPRISIPDSYIRATPAGDFEPVTDRDLPVTAMGWPITPEALYWAPRFFHERYRLPIVITENGMASDDRVADGRVHDQQRIDFLQQYLRNTDGRLPRACRHWGISSGRFIDNFEWAEGYAKRFGLIHVDYATQQRTLKDSAALVPAGDCGQG